MKYLSILLVLFLFSCGEDSTGNQDNYCDITETKENGEIISVDTDDWKPSSLIVNNDSMFIEAQIIPNPIIDHTEFRYTPYNLDSMYVYYDVETFWYENNVYKTGTTRKKHDFVDIANHLTSFSINFNDVLPGCYRMYVVGVKWIGQRRFTVETYGDFKVE